MKKVMLAMLLIFGMISFVSGGELINTFTYPDEDDGGEYISMGDEGSLIFTRGYTVDGGDVGGVWTVIDKYFLLSSYDVNPMTEIWGREINSDFTTGAVASFLEASKIGASKDEDVFVSIRRADGNIDGNADNVVIAKYNSGSETPEWEIIIPSEDFYANSLDLRAEVLVSDDGQKIVALMREHNSTVSRKVKMVVIDSNNGQILIEKDDLFALTPTFGLGFGSAALSGDGSMLVVGSEVSSHTAIINTDNGEYIFETSTFNVEPAKISYDGSRIVSIKNNLFTGGDKAEIKLLEKQSNGEYSLSTVVDEETAFGFDGCEWVGGSGSDDACGFFFDVDISENGNYIYYVYSGRNGNEPQGTRHELVGAYDINSGLYTMKYEIVLDSASDFVAFSKISVSDNGEIFAVGTRYHLTPELYVFDKNQNDPIEIIDTDGPIFDLDISPDGTKVAVMLKKYYNPDGGSSIFQAREDCVYLYEIGEPDLTLHGVPRANSVVRFEQPYLGSGQINRVLYSKTFRPSMTPFGWLYPDRHSLFILPRGIDTGALTRTIFTIPDEVGEEYWFQGWSLEPRGLSENYVKMRVLPAG
ncbi:MAG: hypothetical protein ABIF88_04170 [archaeon]